MFSNNQVLKISGSIENEDLMHALVYALDLFDIKDKKLAYQTTEDGMYCIGWYTYDEAEIGWNGYTFNYNIEAMTLVVKDFILDYIIDIGDFTDKIRPGFLMRSIKDLKYTEREGIENDFYCILVITPYTIYYS